MKSRVCLSLRVRRSTEYRMHTFSIQVYESWQFVFRLQSLRVSLEKAFAFGARNAVSLVEWCVAEAAGSFIWMRKIPVTDTRFAKLDERRVCVRRTRNARSIHNLCAPTAEFRISSLCMSMRAYFLPVRYFCQSRVGKKRIQPRTTNTSTTVDTHFSEDEEKSIASVNVVQSVTSCTPSAKLHAITSMKYGEYDAPKIHHILRWIYYPWNPYIRRSIVLFRRTHELVLFLFHIANVRVTFAHPHTHTRAKGIRHFWANSSQLPVAISPSTLGVPRALCNEYQMELREPI